MKHKIDWTMSGTVEFDADETSPEGIAFEFQDAVSEGFDFMRHGEVDGVTVEEVDDEHVHNWLCYRPSTDDRCTRCGATQPHVHSWFTPRTPREGTLPTHRRCLRCWDTEPIAP